VSKDPFVPLTSSNTTSGGESGGGGTGSGGGGGSGGDATSLSANIEVNSTAYSVVKGDKVPSGSPAFEISSVTTSDVTFAVISGKLENGDSSVSVNLGESVTVTLDSGTKYSLKVKSIGNSGGGMSVSGHTISVLSVSSQDGVAVVTLEIDSKTYSDKKVGDVLSTSAGDIKIVAIDVNAQTVTIMHGDQTLTLRAGQVVVK
jgi:predicted RNA-binding protein with TRAM domain